jgi:hypothetical protein
VVDLGGFSDLGQDWRETAGELEKNGSWMWWMNVNVTSAVTANGGIFSRRHNM